LAQAQTMKKSMCSKVQAYLAHRRALGFQLKSEGLRLLDFARYVDALGHRGPLTNQLAVKWACRPKSADRLWWARRLEIVRTFARHLLLTEPQTQVPPRHWLGPAHCRRSPHLYTGAQLQQLLRRAGQLKGQLQPHTWQTLIGLLTCTGLRISEAMYLKTNDVDWKQSLLIIRESKFGKTRLVPLHPSALPPLRAYAQRRQEIFPLAQYFFVSKTGNRLARSKVGQTFTQLREGIPFSRRPPRLHDLRHTMASRVLQRWQSSRKGATNRILILSRYLGHSHVEDTYWYLTALPQLLADAAQRFVLDEREDR
jgi:integrase